MARASWCEDFVYRAWLTIGRMAPSRASFVLLRDELLEREAFDTLLEAKGALRAVAAALQHDPATQLLGIPAPGPSRRGSPVRSHGVRLSKRTGLVYWRAKS